MKNQAGDQLISKIIDAVNAGMGRDAKGKRIAVTVKITNWLAKEKGLESTEVRGYTNMVSMKAIWIGKVLVPFSQITEVTRFEIK